jgi:hypothetical protein
VNNREMAAVFWLLVVFAWALSQRETRHALWHVLRALMAPKLAMPLLAMVAYVSGFVYVGAQVGLWDRALTNDTVVWFMATGLALYGKSIVVFKAGSSLRAVLLAAVGTTVLVEVFVNLYVFPLVVELVLAPTLALLGAMSMVAGAEDRFATVKRLTDGMVSFIGFAVLMYVAIRVAVAWDQLDQARTWQRFALPVWLTLGALPDVALLGLYSNYDAAFSLVRWASVDRRQRWRARLALVFGLHLRARDVGDFSGLWCKELTGASSFAEARAVIRQFRQRGSDGLAPSTA